MPYAKLHCSSFQTRIILVLLLSLPLVTRAEGRLINGLSGERNATKTNATERRTIESSSDDFAIQAAVYGVAYSAVGLVALFCCWGAWRLRDIPGLFVAAPPAIPAPLGMPPLGLAAPARGSFSRTPPSENSQHSRGSPVSEGEIASMTYPLPMRGVLPSTPELEAQQVMMPMRPVQLSAPSILPKPGTAAAHHTLRVIIPPRESVERIVLTLHDQGS